MKILMRLERETKNALRYQEVDDNMKVVEIGQGAKLGMMYVRKSAFADGGQIAGSPSATFPMLLHVQIDVVEG